MESRCFEIGIKLHLKIDFLKGIESLYPVSFSKRMIEMITAWLNRKYNTERFGDPTWKSLVIAVAASSGGANGKCARDIATKHRVSG